MKNNEIIAEWVGVVPEPRDWTEGVICFMADDPSMLAYCTYVEGRKRWMAWSPSTDITLWHGEDGLLAEIEKRRLEDGFLNELFNEIDAEGSMGYAVWAGLAATPAQLTDALVKTIEEH